MSSKAITEKPVQEHREEEPPATPETAPSLIREDEPLLARLVGMVGTMTAVMGAMGLGLVLAGHTSGLIGLGWGSICLVVGLVAMLFHAVSEKDLQIRRSYVVFGFLWLATGVLLSLVPYKEVVGGLFAWGFLCLAIALLFLIASVRQETDANWRKAVGAAIGITGGILALTGFIGGNVGAGFLLPFGLLLAVMGLAYLWAFVGLEGATSYRGYWAGVAAGVLGLVFALIALGRSVLPPLFHSWGWMSVYSKNYFQSSGLVLMILGLCYAAVGAGQSSENRMVVIFRRELAAFFYSPIAYIVLFGFTAVGCLRFGLFAWDVLNQTKQGIVFVEPVLQPYMFSLLPVIVILFIVPVLTMRLLSEEKRTATWEVLLTAPLGETAVVLSKFFAAVVFFLLLWVPWGLLLIPLRLESGHTLDYRPLFSFFIALTCSGAAFIAMGLFFSSLTRNQIAAALLSFMGMVILFSCYWLKLIPAEGSNWHAVLQYASFVDLWSVSLQGKLVFRDLMFYISAAVFWLFLTVKVLEARKWT